MGEGTFPYLGYQWEYWGLKGGLIETIGWQWPDGRSFLIDMASIEGIGGNIGSVGVGIRFTYGLIFSYNATVSSRTNSDGRYVVDPYVSGTYDYNNVWGLGLNIYFRHFHIGYHHSWVSSDGSDNFHRLVIGYNFIFK